MREIFHTFSKKSSKYEKNYNDYMFDYLLA